ncbi:uncharacterized protein [Montipora foliosa]|uniref:uncharacterized protein n=1 Tax=Montipora foliosa TaxID=591990 RepID=UPI0035F210A3
MFTITIWSLMAIALLVRTRSVADLSEAERRTAAGSSSNPDVSTNMTRCFRKAFLERDPPRDMLLPSSRNRRYICQRRDTSTGHTYSTLFDIGDGIPVYSGYAIYPYEGTDIGTYTRCSATWKQTPGISNQGSDSLYSGSRAADIHRGHLNPCHINSFNQTFMKATFIYTNCVPQCGTSFNSGSWMAYEGRIANYTKERCANQKGGIMYLVTGQSDYRIRVRSTGAVTQVPTPIQYYPNAASRNRLVQPNSLWTAGCCVRYRSRSSNTIVFAESIAVIGNNDRNSSCTLTRAVHLWELEWLLVSPTATYPVDIFPGYSGCRNNSYSNRL